jgi:osmotically-inducible protein OsmY
VPQAESFFSEQQAAAAAAAAYAKEEAALARRVAQLPRPVMSARSDTSITMTIDKRAPMDGTMAVSLNLSTAEFEIPYS